MGSPQSIAWLLNTIWKITYFYSSVVLSYFNMLMLFLTSSKSFYQQLFHFKEDFLKTFIDSLLTYTDLYICYQS